MKIGIANDHSAVDMKNELVSWLEENGYEVVNYGTDTNDSVDYPLYGEKLANAVTAGEVERGIVMRYWYWYRHCLQQGARHPLLFLQ